MGEAGSGDNHGSELGEIDRASGWLGCRSVHLRLELGHHLDPTPRELRLSPFSEKQSNN